MADIEYVVFGAGVIGLACGKELAARKKNFFVLEKESQFGTGISSRNSEVIHSGIYYGANSLKTKLCIEGRKLLYYYCKERGVPFKKTGKLIVAVESDEIPKLKSLYTNGKQNGINELFLWNEEEIRRAEPDISAVAAIYSPETGIVETKDLMSSYLADLNGEYGTLICNKSPVFLEHIQGYWKILLNDGTEFTTKKVINSCGLGAYDFLGKIHDFPREALPAFQMAKGHYFSLTGANIAVSHLIYPLPQIGGLGVHLTLDLAGGVRFGPDVEWVTEENYAVPEILRLKFYDSVKRYLPQIHADQLQPSYAGIRPKLHGPKEKFADFLIQTEKEHGMPGLVNLLGIESPGITSSLAIANLVLNSLEGES
ncbi:FAD dependent oxidoreductase [Leptospira inadai serovar Lyme str. 10]|uniref:FAD dependent oxidoreductase n=2 Tax=Leptospira inadai serovar Lyme TaxID=293084 RepID=V6HII8_9LEPT|nr:NAD(P)/FAD-dependent oxidoreductase [Leptospira inadai]EQA36500.1 FAD dependent oxidoreductase [Leptospira inadai serovar Lyme str. 10]PNV76489.1 FAD-dependent oxidoreductase [Leptospira inadai serovar Lyme]